MAANRPDQEVRAGAGALRPAAGRGRTGVFAAVLVVLAVTLSVYAQTCSYPFIDFDDYDYVVQNPHLRAGLSWETLRWAVTSFSAANWHPLTWLSLAADYQLYGLNAGGYHLTNLLLHATNGVLLLLWLRNATGQTVRSTAVAILFAVHPQHVESVAWVTERKDVLSGTFFFGALLAYTRYGQRGGRGWYLAALGLLAVGLTAKPMLVTFPFLLLLVDHWPLRRGGSAPGRHPGPKDWLPRTSRLVVEKLPFFLLVLTSCVVTYLAQRSGHAVVTAELLPVLTRVGHAVLSYGDYLVKTAVPTGLSIFYPYRLPLNPLSVALWGVVLGLVSGGVIRVRRRRPYLFTGWFWFVGSLVPVIGLVQVGSQSMADRYTYLPHVGLFIILIWGGFHLLGRERWRIRVGGLALAGLVLADLHWARGQAALWESGARLSEASLRTVGPDLRLFELVGNHYYDAGETKKAEQWYGLGLRWFPGHPALSGGAGVVKAVHGAWPEAISLLSVAVRADPNDYRSRNTLGLALTKVGGRAGEAETLLRDCLRIRPDYALAHYNLGALCASEGRWEEALTHYTAVLGLDPTWPKAYRQAAWLLATCPADPWRDGRRALRLARRAAELEGAPVLLTLDCLAAAHAEAGDWEAALAGAEQACRLGESAGPHDAAGNQARRQRLASYALRQPWRTTGPDTLLP